MMAIVILLEGRIDKNYDTIKDNNEIDKIALIMKIIIILMMTLLTILLIDA